MGLHATTKVQFLGKLICRRSACKGRVANSQSATCLTPTTRMRCDWARAGRMESSKIHNSLIGFRTVVLLLGQARGRLQPFPRAVMKAAGSSRSFRERACDCLSAVCGQSEPSVFIGTPPHLATIARRYLCCIDSDNLKYNQYS